jgi:hypothetical protein
MSIQFKIIIIVSLQCSEEQLRKPRAAQEPTLFVVVVALRSDSLDGGTPGSPPPGAAGDGETLSVAGGRGGSRSPNIGSRLSPDPVDVSVGGG